MVVKTLKRKACLIIIREKYEKERKKKKKKRAGPRLKTTCLDPIREGVVHEKREGPDKLK